MAQVVGPGDRENLLRRVFPTKHGRWWTPDRRQAQERRDPVMRLSGSLPTGDDGVADAVLAHAQEIAQTAVDRAAAADRRATTIAGTVAIAASLTLSGASLVFDASKITDDDWRSVLAVLLFATTAAFVASAVYALVALVRYRQWNWSEPWDLARDAQSADQIKRDRAAFLLHNFSGNWEVSDVKNRLVDNALRCLVAALLLLAALAAALALYALT